MASKFVSPEGTPRQLMLNENDNSDDDEDDSGGSTELDVGESKLGLMTDTYGFFLFSSFQFFDEKHCHHAEAAGTIFFVGGFLHLVNLALQFGLTFALLEFSVERQADKFQRIDILAKAPEVDAAAAAGVALNSTSINDEVLQLCNSEHHVPYFQSVVVFIWCAKLFPPLIQSLRFTAISLSMPKKPSGSPMVIVDGPKMLITCVPTWMRYFVLVFINLPRILMQVYLGWMGAEYLIFASSLNVLITKAVGLFFIMDLSTVLFLGFAPNEEKEQVHNVFLCYHEPKKAARHWWKVLGSLFIKFGGSLVVVLWFCRIFHGDIQHFRDACFRYHYAIDVPACEHWGCGTVLFGHRLVN